MNDMLFLVLWLAIIYGPVFVVVKLASIARKNTTWVFITGICLGWIGAALAAVILPRMTDEEIKAAEDAQAARVPWDGMGIVLGGIGIMSAIMLGFMAWMKWG